MSATGRCLSQTTKIESQKPSDGGTTLQKGPQLFRASDPEKLFPHPFQTLKANER